MCPSSRGRNTCALVTVTDDTGSFEVKIRWITAKFANMIIARYRGSRYLVRKREAFIKDKTKVARRVSSNQ